MGACVWVRVCVCDLITSEWARPPVDPLFAPCNPLPFWGRARSQALESAPALCTNPGFWGHVASSLGASVLPPENTAY